MATVDPVGTPAPSSEREEGVRGALWTYTVQRFAPKSPPYVVPSEGFTPFVVGLVEIADRRIAGVIEVSPDEARIGMNLEQVESQGVPHFREVRP